MPKAKEESSEVNQDLKAQSEQSQSGSALSVEELKREIQLLSSRLKRLGEQKEKEYHKKEDLDKRLRNDIQDAKNLREEKKEIDIKISELKKKREEFNNNIKEKFSNLAQLRQKYDSEAKKKGFRFNDISSIKKEIESMQFAIQTEALSFEREKMYMEKIKRLKHTLVDLEAEEQSFKELADFKAKIREEKKEADAIHEEVQKLAAQSSTIFEQLAAKSVFISSTKRDKSQLQEVLRGLKVQIDELNQKLGEFLKSWSSISAQAGVQQDKISTQKATDVLDKFKKKEKLTKEDILILQRDILKGR